MINEITEAGGVPADLIRSSYDRALDFDHYAQWVLTHGDLIRRSLGEAMRQNYERLVFTEAEIASIRAIGAQHRIIALVDVGCPDVAANLPIVARITQINPGIELRILHRPDHLDLAYAVAEAYPGNDGLTHVPTYVVLDEQGKELGALLERPDEVTKFTARRKAAAYREWHQRFPGVAVGDLPEDYRKNFFLDYNSWRLGLLDLERAAVVAWLVRATSGKG